MEKGEHEDEIDRELIFDLVFKYGAKSVTELKEICKDRGRSIMRKRIAKLVEHEWFLLQHGLVYIANADGCRRIVPRLATV